MRCDNMLRCRETCLAFVQPVFKHEPHDGVHGMVTFKKESCCSTRSAEALQGCKHQLGLSGAMLEP